MNEVASRGTTMGTLSRLGERLSANEAAIPVEKAVFTSVMSRVAASVWVVTAGHGESRVGRTVTSLTSLTAEPPRVVAAIAAESPLAKAILAENGFSASLLAEGQEAVGDAFAGRVPPSDRFTPEAWDRWPSGRPRLRDAAASIDCTLVGMMDTGPNHLFIGTLIAALAGEAVPLLWQGRTYRSLVRVDKDKLP